MTPFHAWSSLRRSLPRAKPETGNWQDDIETSTQEVDLPHQEDGERLIDGLISALIDCITISTLGQMGQVLEQRQRSWVETQGLESNSKMARELQAIQTRLATAACSAIEPLFEKALLQKVTKDFSETLRQVLPEFDGEKIEVEVPKHLEAPLDEALRHEGITAVMRVTEGGEIIAKSGEMEISSDLAMWTGKLKAALNP